MPQVGLLIFFDQPYNSLTRSYKKILILRERVADWGQTYSITTLCFEFWERAFPLEFSERKKLAGTLGQDPLGEGSEDT
jgi:hypothetical protein